MARILIVGCGARGQALARALVADGHAVRGTTRDPAHAEAIRAAGAEPYVGDPDRVGSLVMGFDRVTFVVYLLGSASGDVERVTALHTTRWRMLLEKTVDTTIRGVVYEAAGTVPPDVLAEGVAIAEQARATWEIPLELLTADPADQDGWIEAARASIDGLLAPR